MKNVFSCTHTWQLRQEYVEGSMISETRTKVKRYRCVDCNLSKEEREIIAEDTEE